MSTKRDLGLWLTLLGALVTVGLTQLYVPPLQLIRWAIAGVSVGLGVMALLSWVLAPEPNHRQPPAYFLILPLTLFLVLAVASALANDQSLKVFVFGAKGYFQLWGLYLAIALAAAPSWTVDRLPRTLIWVAVLQLPFSLQQFFVLVPARAGLGDGVVPEDVVSGTFGATVTGGGANAALSLFLVVVLTLLMSLYKRGALSLGRLLVGATVVVIPIVLNANRIALVYLLLAYLAVFYRHVLARPGRSLLAGVAFVGLFAGVVWGNMALVSKSDEYSGFDEFVEQTIERTVGEDYHHGEFELNRGQALAFWFTEHRDPLALPFWIGHGVGESRESQQEFVDVNTLASREYPGMGIGLTSVPAVLWELGVFGLLCVVWMFVSACRSAAVLEQHFSDDPMRAAASEAAKVGVLLFAISLFHKNFFVYYIPYQAVLLTLFGYLTYWHVQVARSEVPMGSVAHAD